MAALKRSAFSVRDAVTMSPPRAAHLAHVVAEAARRPVVLPDVRGHHAAEGDELGAGATGREVALPEGALRAAAGKAGSARTTPVASSKERIRSARRVEATMPSRASGRDESYERASPGERRLFVRAFDVPEHTSRPGPKTRPHPDSIDSWFTTKLRLPAPTGFATVRETYYRPYLLQESRPTKQPSSHSPGQQAGSCWMGCWCPGRWRVALAGRQRLRRGTKWLAMT